MGTPIVCTVGTIECPQSTPVESPKSHDLETIDSAPVIMLSVANVTQVAEMLAGEAFKSRSSELTDAHRAKLLRQSRLCGAAVGSPPGFYVTVSTSSENGAGYETV